MSVYKTCKLLLHLFKRYVLASRLESSYQNLEKQRVLYHLITLQPICITFILVKSVFLTTKLSSEYISTCTKTSTISHTTDFSTFQFKNLFAVFICESNYSINKNPVVLYLALIEGCSLIYTGIQAMCTEIGYKKKQQLGTAHFHSLSDKLCLEHHSTIASSLKNRLNAGKRLQCLLTTIKTVYYTRS